jgi:hypothetical protein
MSVKAEKTEQIGCRLPVTMIKQLDDHAKHLRETTGMGVTRTDALRILLKEALDGRGKKK